MPADEIAMVLAYPARQRLDQRTAPTFQPRAAELGNLAGIGLASSHRRQHATPAHAHRIAQNRRKLDVGVLQDLLDAMLVTNRLTHRLPARPRQVAQLPDRL